MIMGKKLIGFGSLAAILLIAGFIFFRFYFVFGEGVKAGELNRCFTGCPDLRRVDLSGVTTVGQYGMNDAFNGNKSLTTCLLNSLTRIGDAKAPSGLTRAFCGCTSITRVGDVDPGVSGKATGVDLRSLAAIGACGPGGSGGMANCFRDCTALKTVGKITRPANTATSESSKVTCKAVPRTEVPFLK